MRHLLRMSDLNDEEIPRIFDYVRKLFDGKYTDLLIGKTIALFFPETSIRTKITFEKAIRLLGGEYILIPNKALLSGEDMQDLIGYINNWADMIIVRSNDFKLIEEMSLYSRIPIINAMTSDNHPCEILSDLYGFSKIRFNYLDLKYVYVGGNSNIGKTWFEASKILNFDFIQACPKGFEIEENRNVYYSLEEAIRDADIVLTDTFSDEEKFAPFLITKDILKLAKSNVLVNPCPPFKREIEVSSRVINSQYFVGYEFKKYLLFVEMAIICFCINEKKG